jgi:hypothetical protein
MKYFIKRYKNLWHRLAMAVLSIAFLTQSLCPLVFASSDILPPPHQMITLSGSFKPVELVGLKVNPKDSLHFDFIVDKGEEQLEAGDFKNETLRLVRYFLSAMTTPKEDLWVNLSPYEGNRIVPSNFGAMEMGRDLLAQDYILKQATSSLMYPEAEIGKTFWKKIFEQALKMYGTTNIPVNTFNKVWIVPDSADLLETSGTVIITQNHLKVMLEEDYVAKTKHHVAGSESSADILKKSTTDKNQIGSQMIREIVIPALEKEVNNGKNFARLRQIYNALILATWYKKKIYEGILAKSYMNRNKIGGTSIKDNGSPQFDADQIYKQYLIAFKKGVYNYIKEDVDAATGSVIPRKYFSGGAYFGNVEPRITTDTSSAMISRLKSKYLSPVLVAIGLQLLSLNGLAQGTNQSNNFFFEDKANTNIVKLVTIAADKNLPSDQQTNAAKEAGVLILKTKFSIEVENNASLVKVTSTLFPKFIALLKQFPDYEFTLPSGDKYTASVIAGYLERHAPEVTPSNAIAMYKGILEMK